ncbi:MFS monocarboxylate transporter [Phlyctema vagabunda]|uniref:MFS monocarboxylate transporter n=1 Tax=Phlyctema vagabunda TaxID=108571 RepID=A0ABR4PE27_9HELO
MSQIPPGALDAREFIEIEPAPVDFDEKKVESGAKAALTKVTSRITKVITTSSAKEIAPPPDGGVVAWTQTAMTTLIIFNTWGYINSFGVFQTYYVNELGYPPSNVSWVGATDAGYLRIVLIVGSVLQVIGIFMTSISTKYWHLLLAQGLCTGLGDGLVFCPSLALLSTYFSTKRSLALGITSAGSGIGGLVFPAIVQQLLPKIGFAWTVRVLGFVVLGTSALTIALTKTRLPPRKTGKLIEWGVFCEPPFAIFTAGMFLCFWGLYFAFYYIGSYGREIIGVDQSDSISLLLIMNGISIVGRLVPNVFADRYFGPLNMIIPFCFISSLLIYSWAAIHTKGGLFGWAAVYGLFVAGVQSLFPAVVSSLTKDLKTAGIRMGMFFTVVSFACLTGPPLGGFLIERNGGNYLYAQVWAASCLFAGGCLHIIARLVGTKGKLIARI